MTISHLRFGPRPIRSTYLISRAQFVACHQPFLLETCDVLKDLAPAELSCSITVFDPRTGLGRICPKIRSEG